MGRKEQRIKYEMKWALGTVLGYHAETSVGRVGAIEDSVFEANEHAACIVLGLPMKLRASSITSGSKLFLPPAVNPFPFHMSIAVIILQSCLPEMLDKTRVPLIDLFTEEMN
jgi:hypothetical protein